MNPAHWIARGEQALESGDAAVDALQVAIAGLAAAEGNPAADRARAGCCERLADLLEDAGDLPRSLQCRQEAVDCFGRVGAEEDARRCARRVVEGVRALRLNPGERLMLLIARLEREQRQLSVQPGSEASQAGIAFRIATILHRQDRFLPARLRYQEALGLFQRAGDSGLAQAACHHRLAGLFHYELRDPSAAADHYRLAIAFYAAHESYSEGEQMNRRLCEDLLHSLTGP